MEDARALLNGLMGADRNASVSKGQRRARTFRDEDVCKKFLLGLCPHEMFTNTKMDLGPCGKHHNEHLKDAFEADGESAHYRRKWRGALRSQLKQLLEGIDRRIETNQARIAREREVGIRAMDEGEKQIVALKEEVSEKLKQAEKMADDGCFDESRAVIKETEATKRQIEDLELKSADKYEKEHVCDVCGQIVSAEEAKDILKYGRGWHTDGKQHIGFKIIRDKLKELDDERALDKRNGIRTPSPSPVKAERKDSSGGKMAKAPSPTGGQKRADGRRRKASLSRSPRQRRRTDDRRDDRRRRASRSRSRKPEANRARSPTNGRRADARKRLSPSPRRSRSPWRRDGSRTKPSRSRKRCSPSPMQRRRCSPSLQQRERHLSPRRRSRSLDGSPPLRSSSEGGREERHRGRDPLDAGGREAESETSSKQPVKFVLGLGKLNVTSLPEKKQRTDSSCSSAAPVPPPSASAPPCPPSPEGSRTQHRKKRSRRANSGRVSDTERSAAHHELELPKTDDAGRSTRDGNSQEQQPAADSAKAPMLEPSAPEPPAPEPPRTVRFVLGLGKLNMTALGKK